ncbi:MAG: hypothetical protein HOV87_21760, partial [Catenulispora sp.]|nr:hypothetical protein [Catenulispora sp.]
PAGRPPAGPPRRTEPRRPPEPEKSGKTGYIVLAVAGIAAIIAAILLAKSLLKSGGNNDTKQVPDFHIGTMSAQQAQQLLAQPENKGWSLAGSGQDCPNDVDRHTGNKDTIIAQSPAAGGFIKPQAITYCLSLGPQLGAVPTKAVLNTWDEGTLKTYLTKAGFNIASPIVTQQNDDKIPAGKIIDVNDNTNGNVTSIAGKQNLNVGNIQIGWVISQGQKQIPLTAQQFKGVNVDDAVRAIQGQGFTKVQKLLDKDAPGQPNSPVTKITPGDGPYAPDQQILVYYAPAPPPPPTTPSTSQTCDPSQGQDCTTSPTTQPTGTATSTSGGPSTNPSCQIGIFGCPSTPTSTKHGGG